MVSLLGIAVLLGIAFALSSAKRNINWRTVGGAFAIQASVGAFVLYSEPGKEVLLSATRFVANIIAYSQEGINFLFGPIGDKSIAFIFAFNVLPVIVFFSALIAVLYHLKVMGLIIKVIGGFLQKALGTSRPESMSSAANIFVGQTEAPLVVRPFIPHMTSSELFAIMVGGLASIAGSVMAGYAGMGVDLKYLLAASFMAAPGGLLMAKIMLPETSKPNEDLHDVDAEDTGYANVFDAAASGAASGMQLALNVGAMLLAFIALIAMFNGLIGWTAGLFGYENVTFEGILGYVLQPLAWAIGVPWEEAQLAGSFIGQKMVVNEFVAYLNFLENQSQLSEASQAIITFALCGFANFSSIAILMGGIGAMAPTRRKEIARLGLKAVIAATLSNLMSAALAGFYLSLG
ncbi:NupC/NupG family nucleoside CNT transporter [Alteromonas macleodii]|jgi:CNT family concentrative nucleoside transporter|uniref:Nucleoside permease n=2 Tax=Alteromonas macleodii TaxID=28108 RepID=A0A126Q3I1_ALTMA|nr:MULTISPECIES: NupC/NupG family nucleoside CNT transporter [Alteromonas]MEC7284309.1 NupC/NupG family nucleoside CNT transporter [Pseudomonadota bacterium]NKX21946.1 NupC/NupG family nucleoside CNT transporter [Alteromonadaceae bacterium A_SAG2]NKX32419.1 NupC/NupG family nucleoside CNT transporter [Alteromonadaceae bacterium A_SAG1]AFS38753.1 putative Na+ dependent nucleoside transporter [Alteromonas macleodii ATCC 27126]AFT76000.1 putative Na+ dependent nucleoside transporter [Alteromonas |tara:strand:+ start:51 stop:1262 length:1212 start_codon:yes stop_codon:yes gene_type:complete